MTLGLISFQFTEAELVSREQGGKIEMKAHSRR